ncbi:hypothetical protein RP20_CCG019071 [Aedes albopictus]|nr:hypothetical protein RP20_CCG019071 [Aedes albopictus]
MDASVVEMDSIEQSGIQLAHETTVSVRRIRELWSEIFNECICQDHMSRLPEQIQTFFSEVYEESEGRKRNIVKAIESAVRRNRSQTAAARGSG